MKNDINAVEKVSYDVAYFSAQMQSDPGHFWGKFQKLTFGSLMSECDLSRVALFCEDKKLTDIKANLFFKIHKHLLFKGIFDFLCFLLRNLFRIIWRLFLSRNRH